MFTSPVLCVIYLGMERCCMKFQQTPLLPLTLLPLHLTCFCQSKLERDNLVRIYFMELQ